MRIDGYASEDHFAEHVAAVLAAVPPEHRGPLHRRSRAIVDRGDVALVSATGDLRQARALGFRRVALMEHGAGQSYGGNRLSGRMTAYAGGAHRDADLFLHPGPHPAARDRARYPSTPIAIVGSPILDALPARQPGPGPVVAVAFHFDASISPEARSGFRWIREAVRELAGAMTVIGHGHPRAIDHLAGWYAKAGIETVRDFADVCRRADVLVADNTSAMFAFAATGRDVVVLNPPWYRPGVEHGLRFWQAAGVGVNVNRPEELRAAVDAAIAGSPEITAAREAALDLVYAYRSGAAARAADALVSLA